MFDATCRVSACVSASSPQNATNLVNLHLYTAPVWFTNSVTQIIKKTEFCGLIPWKRCMLKKLNPHSFCVVRMHVFTIVDR
jgi:hypothetical protein